MPWSAHPLHKSSPRPLLISALSVAETSKARLVIDLSPLNAFLSPPRFTYETLSLLGDLLPPQEDLRLIKYDLTAGFHHIDIRLSDQAYLGFHWGGTDYVFRSLPFGLSSAPHAFTTLLRALASRWRAFGLRIILYIDDGLLVARLESIFSQRDRLLTDLSHAGLLINLKKSLLEPVTRAPFLGFDVDVASRRFYLPDTKAHAIRSLLLSSAALSSISGRQLLRLAGKLLSTGTATGSLAYTYTRYMFAAANPPHLPLDSQRPITPAIRSEFDFWLGLNLTALSVPISIPPSRIDLQLATDAGDRLWGAVLPSLGLRAQGHFSSIPFISIPNGPSSSAPLRELYAILAALQPTTFLAQARGHEVLLRTDSETAHLVLSKGGTTSPSMHGLALHLFQHCLANSIRLKTMWIPRSANSAADAITHDPDSDAWHILPSVFTSITTALGRPTSDLFASKVNAKAPIYVTRYFDPAAAWCDAFTRSWNPSVNPLIGSRPYLCPPFHLLARTLRKLEEDRAAAILVLPIWARQPWWPLVTMDGAHWAPFVQKVLYLAATPPATSIFGRDSDATLPPPPFTRAAAVYISFSASPVLALRCIWGKTCRVCTAPSS